MQTKAIKEIYPLSFMQQSLLMHHLHEDEDQGFLQVKYKLKGNLDLIRFKEAFHLAFQKHKALRASIHWQNLSHPVQIVHNNFKVPWRVFDWSTLQESEIKTMTNDLLIKDRLEKFDLTKVPISRVHLIRHHEDDYMLIWTCHHILMDGWSSFYAISEILQIYEQLVMGEQFESMATQSFFDHLKWIRNKDNSDAEIFWSEQLNKINKPLLLFPGNQKKRHNTEFLHSSVTLERGQSELLKEFSKNQAVTLNATFQAFWALLLSKLLKSDHIVFGSTVNGRTGTGLKNAEEIIGMFMNVIPVSVNINEKETFVQMVKSIQTFQNEVLKYDYLSLKDIMDFRNDSYNISIFDTLFIFQNLPEFKLEGGNIKITDYKSSVTSTYPFTIVVNNGSHISLEIIHDSSLDAEFVQKLLSNLTLLIEIIIQDFNKAIHQLKKILDFPNIPISIKEHEAFKVEKKHAGRKYQRNIQGTNQSRLQKRLTQPEDYVAPQTTIQSALVELWEEIFGFYPIGINDNFFEIGGTSTMAVQLFAQIEKHLACNLSPSELLSNPTIEGLSKKIRNKESNDSWVALVPLREKGSKRPLFCLHAGGAHVLFYNDLARNLDEDQPVYAIQPLGLDDIEKAHKSIEDMSRYYVDEIRKVQPQGPYALLGTCFSDAVAVEMARQLDEKGQDVAPLIIVDSTPKGENIDKIKEKQRFKDYLKLLMAGDFKYLTWAVKKKSTLVFNKLLKKKLPAVKPAQKSEQEIQLENLTSIRVNMARLYRKYEWKTYSGKITYILSEGFASAAWSNLLVKNWDRIAKGGVETFKIPGNHFTIFEEPEVKGLAMKVNQCLSNSIEYSNKMN